MRGSERGMEELRGEGRERGKRKRGGRRKRVLRKGVRYEANRHISL